MSDSVSEGREITTSSEGPRWEITEPRLSPTLRSLLTKNLLGSDVSGLTCYFWSRLERTRGARGDAVRRKQSGGWITRGREPRAPFNLPLGFLERLLWHLIAGVPTGYGEGWL